MLEFFYYFCMLAIPIIIIFGCIIIIANLYNNRNSGIVRLDFEPTDLFRNRDIYRDEDGVYRSRRWGNPRTFSEEYQQEFFNNNNAVYTTSTMALIDDNMFRNETESKIQLGDLLKETKDEF